MSRTYVQDKVLEDRMTPALKQALRPILFFMEEQDVTIQAENDRILDACARAAWREFRKQCSNQ